jgi:hypothetical protein
LRRALDSALAQTFGDVEILVSDNASTDDTPQVVRDAGPRVHYLRNSSNVGAWPNFAKLVEAAEGEYFSFLQDDDLIHCEFVRRAFEALTSSRDVIAFAAYVAANPSTTTLWWSPLYGPPMALDWSRGTRRVIDGKLIAAFSIFLSVAIPPAIAFRTDVLRRAIRQCRPELELFNERVLLTAAATEGAVAIEPYVAAIWFKHDDQACRVIPRSDALAMQNQWRCMAEHVGRHLESWGETWERPFRETLQEVAAEHRYQWIVQSRGWRDVPRPARRVMDLLRESLAGSREASLLDADSAMKNWARDVTPPILWRFVRRCVKGPV